MHARGRWGPPTRILAALAEPGRLRALLPPPRARVLGTPAPHGDAELAATLR